MNLPDLAILFLTYKRTYEALTTIDSTLEHLKYPADQIKWYVADDGSPGEHFRDVMNFLQVRTPNIIGAHNEKFSDIPYAAGKGWNRGLGLCYQATDFVLVLEDDWRMDADLDMTRYVRLLMDEETRFSEGTVDPVGVVSFRILAAGADVHTLGWDGEMFLKYHRTTQYAYSGNPHLRHARYTKHYGWYAEDRSPGMIELEQDDRYRLDVRNGPVILRPAMLDSWGGWHHIGTEKTWK